MRAYVASMSNQGTTMVLSPDSDFFRFFNSGAGTGNSATPTPAPAVAPQPAAPPAPAGN